MNKLKNNNAFPITETTKHMSCPHDKIVIECLDCLIRDLYEKLDRYQNSEAESLAVRAVQLRILNEGCYMGPEHFETLAAMGVNLNGSTDNDTTPLSLAAEALDIGLLDILLHKNVKPTQHGKSTALFFSVRNSFPYAGITTQASLSTIKLAIKLILDKGASPLDSCGSHNEGFSILESAILHEAPLEIIKVLFEKAVKKVESRSTRESEDLRTSKDLAGALLFPFIYTSHKRLDLLDFLIEHGADINSKGIYGNTPLSIAAFRGRHACVKTFLSKGADPLAKNDCGQTVFFLALYGGSSPVIKTLLDATAITYRQELDENPHVLHAAIQGTHQPSVESFLALGADPNLKNCHGESCLHTAAQGCEEAPEIVTLLLRDKRIHLNARNNAGRTPFFAAAIAGNVKVLAILLQAGVDIACPDNKGHDVLHCAQKCIEAAPWKNKILSQCIALIEKQRACKHIEKVTETDDSKPTEPMTLIATLASV